MDDNACKVHAKKPSLPLRLSRPRSKSIVMSALLQTRCRPYILFFITQINSLLGLNASERKEYISWTGSSTSDKKVEDTRSGLEKILQIIFAANGRAGAVPREVGEEYIANCKSDRDLQLHGLGWLATDCQDSDLVPKACCSSLLRSYLHPCLKTIKLPLCL